LNTSFPHLL
jgi:alpha-tubulin suppressor-like RCC1 family protein